MESRKRAEQHEQEFLRTIHSENAAFSRVVSLFEDGLEELRSDSSSDRSELQVQVDEIRRLFSETKQQLDSKIQADIVIVKQAVEKLECNNTNMSASLTSQIDAVQAKLMAFISSSDFKTKDSQNKLGEVVNSLERMNSDLSLLRSQTGAVEQKLTVNAAEFAEEHNAKLVTIDGKIGTLNQSLETRLDDRIREAEQKLRSLFESRIGGLEEQMVNRITEERELTVTGLEEKVSTVQTELRQEFRQAVQDSTCSFSTRLNEIDSRLEAAVPRESLDLLIGEKISALNIKEEAVRMNEEKIRELEGKLNRVQIDMNDKLLKQSAMMTAIAHSGFRYDWNISNAITRFSSLGLLGGSGGGKFVSSELFSIGPYKNLSIRIFPLSTISGDAPTVWLINRPASPDAVIPLYVDVSVGLSKRGPIKRKQVQELFGHWIWEASFPSDILTSELRGEDLSVSIEISMRQWMDLDRVSDIQASTASEEPVDMPESPSAMSNYTFVPVPTSNPFEGSVTPRRSSWAQFGSPPLDENEPPRLASNPFK